MASSHGAIRSASKREKGLSFTALSMVVFCGGLYPRDTQHAGKQRVAVVDAVTGAGREATLYCARSARGLHLNRDSRGARRRLRRALILYDLSLLEGASLCLGKAWSR